MARQPRPSDAKEQTELLLAGLGMWGQTWIDVIRNSPYWRAAGYVDLKEEQIAQAVEEHGIDRSNCYTDLEEAIDDTDVEAVACVVPPAFHLDVARTAFEHGLHVLSEKPLADDIQNARAMIEAADEHDRKLMVSQNYRFKRGPRTVRKVFDRELVGDPGYVSIDFRKAPEFSGYQAETEYPLLSGMSIHHFDQLRYVLGLDAQSVYAESADTEWSNFAHEAVCSVTFRMEGGVLVNYFGSWDSQGAHTTWDGDWTIDCAGGEIDWSDNEVCVVSQDTVTSVFEGGFLERSGYGTSDKGLLDAELVDMPMESRQYSLLEFHQSIEEDRLPETHGRDNIRSLAMVQAALQSAEEGRPVDIDEFLAE